MNIIKSDVILPQHDALWADISPMLQGTSPKSILILATDPGQAYEIQLQKMIEACKLSPDQYNLIKVGAEQPIAWHQLKDKLKPGIVFLIGVTPLQLGISASLRFNLPNRFADCVWLPTASVSDLDKYPDIKKQLWLDGMKPVFVDKSFGGF